MRQIEVKSATSFKYAVVCAYDCAYGAKGTFISRHSTLSAAQNAVNDHLSGGWLAIAELVVA